jgi:hypothetical protein
VGEDLFEAVFFISPQLSNDVILGCNFLKEYKMHLHFDSETLEYVRDGTIKRHVFTITNSDNCEMEVTTARTCYESTSSEISETPAKFPELLTTRQIRDVGRLTINNAAYEPTNTDRTSADSSKLKDEAIHQSDVKDLDSRGMTEEELNTVVEQSESLNAEQKLKLYDTLIRYLPSFTDKPGKCKLLKYEFHVKADQPLRSFSRPVPFSLRPAVKEQIQRMLRDDVLELSYSDVF